MCIYLPCIRTGRLAGSATDPNERKKRRTAHILHRDLELFPAPAILASIHLGHHILELYKSRFRFVTQVVLGDFVPALFWHLALDTTSLDLLKPLVHGHIPLRIAIEPGWILPGCKHRVKVKLFDLESVEHSLEISSGKRERMCDGGKATTVTDIQSVETNGIQNGGDGHGF